MVFCDKCNICVHQVREIAMFVEKRERLQSVSYPPRPVTASPRSPAAPGSAGPARSASNLPASSVLTRAAP